MQFIPNQRHNHTRRPNHKYLGMGLTWQHSCVVCIYIYVYIHLCMFMKGDCKRDYKIIGDDSTTSTRIN